MKYFLSLIFFFITINSSAAVWFDPNFRVWVGNMCQTSMGVDMVPPQPVGSTCFSQRFNTYGFIANR